jgi:formylglycine-generating enzyme required for sulfatase activity
MGDAVDKVVDKKARKVSRRTKAGIAVIVACLAAGGIWYYMAGQRHWPETVLDLGNNVKMRLVLIPAGKFMMGSPATEAGRGSDEGPQHEVTISRPFYMGVFEVTQEQYEQVMGVNPSGFKGAKNPVENVSWDDAVEFCKKLSARTGKKVVLPTEAQWEYACRAGTTTAFHTGDALEPGQANANFPSNPGVWDRIMAWLGMSSGQKAKTFGTTPAGSFPPNGFGLYDMHGNVFEWCSDWYNNSYANLPAGQAGAKNQDPTGPDSGLCRVLHGGSWCPYLQHCRSASRNWYSPDYRYITIGFRVAMDLPAGQAGLK